jgi:hypothetical protein
MYDVIVWIKIVTKGDPRNFAITPHWDALQPICTTYKNCWTLEITYSILESLPLWIRSP